MEKNKQDTDKSESQEILHLVYATNISVVIILCLCATAYFIVEKRIQLNTTKVCLNISHNSDLLILLICSFIVLPQLLTSFRSKKHKFTDTIYWKIHTVISWTYGILYLPIYFIYLMLCSND